MRKIKTLLIDLTIAAVVGIATAIALDAADNVINHVALSFYEQILMKKTRDNSTLVHTPNPPRAGFLLLAICSELIQVANSSCRFN